MGKSECLQDVVIEPIHDVSSRLSDPKGRAESRRGAGHISYRALQPGDYESLRKAHFDMFPVDYEDVFFQRAVNRQDGLESLAAVSREGDGREQLIGFVTTRAFYLYECDPVDRTLLGLGHRLLDCEMVSYILTLGVAPAFRNKGIATQLIRWVVTHAKAVKSRAVYLHVIAYNAAAIHLYRQNAFSEFASRKNFYVIWSGRQMNPNQDTYDAFLYALVIDGCVNMTPLKLFVLALAPFRPLLHSLLSCLPWHSPRGTYFGGGDLSSLSKLSVPSLPQQRGSAPWWIRSLFSRRPAVQ